MDGAAKRGALLEPAGLPLLQEIGMAAPVRRAGQDPACRCFPEESNKTRKSLQNVNSREKVRQERQAVNEALAVVQLAKAFDGHWCFPNVAFGRSEIDLAVVTRGAGLLWEIEVKLNMADWRKDALKRKWTDPQRKYVARMYYAVLPEMLDVLLPAHVTPDMGLLVFTSAGYVREVRAARSRHAPKLPDMQMRAWLESTYHRFWRERLHRHRQAKPERKAA